MQAIQIIAFYTLSIHSEDNERHLHEMQVEQTITSSIPAEGCRSVWVQAVKELRGMVREANQLLATSTSLERKYHALPHYAAQRLSMSLEEDSSVRHLPTHTAYRFHYYEDSFMFKMSILSQLITVSSFLPSPLPVTLRTRAGIHLKGTGTPRLSWAFISHPCFQVHGDDQYFCSTELAHRCMVPAS